MGRVRTKMGTRTERVTETLYLPPLKIRRLIFSSSSRASISATAGRRAEAGRLEMTFIISCIFLTVAYMVTAAAEMNAPATIRSVPNMIMVEIWAVKTRELKRHIFLREERSMYLGSMEMYGARRFMTITFTTWDTPRTTVLAKMNPVMPHPPYITATATKASRVDVRKFTLAWISYR